MLIVATPVASSKITGAKNLDLISNFGKFSKNSTKKATAYVIAKKVRRVQSKVFES